MKRLKGLLQKLIVITMLLGGIGSIAAYHQPEQTVAAAHRRSPKSHHHLKKAKKRRSSKKKRKLSKKRPLRKIKKSRKIDYNERDLARVIRILRHTPRASVYINIPRHLPDYALTKEAMAAWNRTGAFTFKQTTSLRRARIIVMAGIWPKAAWAGLTEMPNLKYGYLYGSEIRLNDYYLLMSDHQLDLDVAEHELGHAMGLMHNTKEKSVMNPVMGPDNKSSIQPVDVQAVKKLYGEK